VKLSPVKVELVQLVRMVELLTEEEDAEGETVIMDGTYAVDDQGRVWKLDKGMTGVFMALASDDPPHEQVRQRGPLKK